MQKRLVKIVRRTYPYKFWGVYYIERKPRGRYMAAQFDLHYYSLDSVIEWVKNNPKLELQSVVGYL